MARRIRPFHAEERASINAAIFLRNRLTKSEAITWALDSTSGDFKRTAINAVVNSYSGRDLPEPWRTTWRLIQESWDKEIVGDRIDDDHDIYAAGDRIKSGERTGSLIKMIVQAVEPVLEIKPADQRYIVGKLPKRPKEVHDLVWADISSKSRTFDPEILHIKSICESVFLSELADSLNGALQQTFHIARRIDPRAGIEHWRYRIIKRVYYVRKEARSEDGDSDPDEFHQDIVPLVKLLFAVVERLAELKPAKAELIAKIWRIEGTSLHIRLWAGIMRKSSIATMGEIENFITESDDRQFWDIHHYPEVAELRAYRFKDLSESAQHSILKRIRKLPPRSHWPKKLEATKVNAARKFWAARELIRIQKGGAPLPDAYVAWLAAIKLQIPDVNGISRIDDGFAVGPRVRTVLPDPDNQFDLLKGASRLEALEKSFAAGRLDWMNNPGQRALDWLRQPGRAREVISDFELTGDAGAKFPFTWDHFGWNHKPDQETAAEIDADRVSKLVLSLPDDTLQQSIEGLSVWLDHWEANFQSFEKFVALWTRLWPFATEATNARAAEEKPELSAKVDAKIEENEKIDTLNPPVGRLMSAFLSRCPNLKNDPEPFSSKLGLRQVRDAAIIATGRAGLIARHRMIEHLAYFKSADRAWTLQNLIIPIQSDTDDSLILWQAVARKTRFTDVLELIGLNMIERASDVRLGRETRQSLVFSIVVECLHSFREKRPPAIPLDRVQQMLRLLDDEVRAHAAEAIQQFVRQVSAKHEGEPSPPSKESLYWDAAKPFLEDVWPLERSLVRPGVARALCDLPASSGEMFADAVAAIDRFLMPIDCWSLFVYGLYGEENDKPKLELIDSAEKARALVHLLDRTIGDNEDAIVPHDLGDALERIKIVIPKITSDQAYRRLLALARR